MILFRASPPCIAMENLLNVGGQKHSTWPHIYPLIHMFHVFYVSRIFDLAVNLKFKYNIGKMYVHIYMGNLERKENKLFSTMFYLSFEINNENLNRTNYVYKNYRIRFDYLNKRVVQNIFFKLDKFCTALTSIMSPTRKYRRTGFQTKSNLGPVVRPDLNCGLIRII